MLPQPPILSCCAECYHTAMQPRIGSSQLLSRVPTRRATSHSGKHRHHQALAHELHGQPHRANIGVHTASTSSIHGRGHNSVARNVRVNASQFSGNHSCHSPRPPCPGAQPFSLQLRECEASTRGSRRIATRSQDPNRVPRLQRSQAHLKFFEGRRITSGRLWSPPRSTTDGYYI